MSLKLTDEGSLCHIIKCSVAVAVILNCNLVIGVTVLVQKVIDSGIKIEQNLFDINDSFTFCMLLIRQQSLFNKQQ